MKNENNKHKNNSKHQLNKAPSYWEKLWSKKQKRKAKKNGLRINTDCKLNYEMYNLKYITNATKHQNNKYNKEILKNVVNDSIKMDLNSILLNEIRLHRKKNRDNIDINLLKLSKALSNYADEYNSINSISCSDKQYASHYDIEKILIKINKQFNMINYNELPIIKIQEYNGGFIPSSSFRNTIFKTPQNVYNTPIIHNKSLKNCNKLSGSTKPKQYQNKFKINNVEHLLTPQKNTTIVDTTNVNYGPAVIHTNTTNCNSNNNNKTTTTDNSNNTTYDTNNSLFSTNTNFPSLSFGISSKCNNDLNWSMWNNELSNTTYNKYSLNSFDPPQNKTSNPNSSTNANQTPITKKKVTINREINGLQDLLKLIEDCPIKHDIEYNINMHSIHSIKRPLQDLNNMIGMQKLKDSVIDQIIYFAQDLHKNNDFLHTVIYGPPGTGKTELAKIIGNIFSSIGILEKNIFKKVTRADLIAGYLGQTAIKTREVIKSCLGGVLFIDEAYALGHSEKRDSFAKECIDTLCECLSDNKSNIMVIIAGYEDDLNKCFFSYNSGLNSRFPWRFNTDTYTPNDLNLIFQKKVKDISWSFKTTPMPDSWFEDNMDYFKFFGRDMETLLAKTKIAHGRRVFCKDKSEKCLLTHQDIERGFMMFKDNNEVNKRTIDNMKSVSHMYL